MLKIAFSGVVATGGGQNISQIHLVYPCTLFKVTEMGFDSIGAVDLTVVAV